MDMEIRELLEDEMTKCNSLKLFKNRVRKCNEILPDCVLDNVLSFIQCGCKKCDRTRRAFREPIRIQMLRKEWENVDVEEIYGSKRYTSYREACLKVWFYYFQELNHIPRKPTVYRRFGDFDETDYINCKNWYESLYLKNFGIYRNHLDHTLKNHEFILWMLYQRGCQFYPEIFDGEFKREVMYSVFVRA